MLFTIVRLGMLTVADLVWSESGSKEVQRMKQWLKEKNVDDLPRAPLDTQELEEVNIFGIKEDGNVNNSD